MGGVNDATQKRKTNPVADVGGRIEHIRCRDAGGKKRKANADRQWPKQNSNTEKGRKDDILLQVPVGPQGGDVTTGTDPTADLLVDN